jgi:hypothetical protein
MTSRTVLLVAASSCSFVGFQGLVTRWLVDVKVSLA